MQNFTMNTTIRLTIVVLGIIISLPAEGTASTDGVVVQGSSERNCSYSIEIETSCAPSAETTDHISVRFSDSSGNQIIVKHLKNPKLLYAPKEGLKKQGGAYGGFQRCAVDLFEATGPCMNMRVCSLYLKRVGSDGWRPGWAKVLRREDGGRAVPDSYMFYFRTFVPGNVWYGFDYCHSRDRFVPHVATFEDLV